MTSVPPPEQGPIDRALPTAHAATPSGTEPVPVSGKAGIANAYGAPISNLAELDDLDDDEMIEGYRDGLNGQPEPRGNRSRSYWHGWRNGAVDGKHREGDASQQKLARDYVARGRGK